MRKIGFFACLAFVASLLPLAAAEALPTDAPDRSVEAVVMTGAQLQTWSRTAAVGRNTTHAEHLSDGNRDAHNGTLIVPPDARTGVDVDDIVAYRYEGSSFVEIPVQVDERFPYFLANVNSDSTFGPVYSGTDEELTYEWDVESWKMQFNQIDLEALTCSARYAESAEEIAAATDAGWMSLGANTAPQDMFSAMQDPVATLDNDDEVVFMASDAGAQAPLGTAPEGASAERQEIIIRDPRDPATNRFVYLFLKDGGSKFDATNGYVEYKRDANADEWIDRNTYLNGEPENLGSSNTGYGPNIPGLVCTDDPKTEIREGLDDPETLDVVEEPRTASDRFVRDGVTVSTPAYRWYASGRWMVRSMQVAKPDQPGVYGPDLIDRWKGRAFQQSPNSSISLVGFEDEQVNWEANSALLGERYGAVRAIREIWGADSGTNVTKTETFYRNAITYRYRVRVHPIPPDGLYTSWDYNAGVATTYFNESHAEGIDIDGRNDDLLNVDETPTGQPAFFDATDPTHSKPLANLNWEQVSGKDDFGSLVYMFEMKNAQSLENPLVVPYYRDDACLDDGTGDNPSPRQFPGDASTDEDVYPPELQTCVIDSTDPAVPDNWQQRQGCFACHGVHYFITGDTDNAFSSATVTEIDGQQWQWAVPTTGPTAIGDIYANTVKIPLVSVAVLQSGV